MTVSKAIARAWTDPDYKAKLLADPHAALAEVGVSVPAGTTIKVLADTAETKHLVLPISPADVGEVTVEELEKVLKTEKIEVPVGTLGYAAC
jgi:hypothetical protein